MKRRLTVSGDGNPNPSTKTSKISTENIRKTIPEAVVVEILAKLPLKIIARFKSVCKSWKSEIESAYFRRRFFSLHRNSSSSSWSLIFRTLFHLAITEAISFHGCDSWDLPKSLASYDLPSQQYPSLPPYNYYYIASSNGLIWIQVLGNSISYMGRTPKSFVGNLISQQWVEIPRPPDDCEPTGLVTRVENGVVSSFKVVRTCGKSEPKVKGMYVWRVYVFSSETGLWSFKRLLSSFRVTAADPPVNIDGMLYLWEKNSRNESGVVVAYDFYGTEEEGGDRCKVIPLPYPDNMNVRRCLTSSRGDVIYLEILDQTLKVWKLSNNNHNNNCESSKLLWQLSLNMATVEFDVYCFPLAMNPFDAEIIYLWSQQHACLVSGNLQTLEFVVHQESENWSKSGRSCCHINNYDSKKYMDGFCDDSTSVIILSQFVLPPWMDPVPRPPLIR